MSKFKSIDLKTYAIDSTVLRLIPVDMIERYTIMPLKLYQNNLLVATEQPDDLELKSLLETECGHPIQFVISNVNDIRASILSHLKISSIFSSLETTDYDSFNDLNVIQKQRVINPNKLSNLPSIPKIPDLVDLILYHAISHGASDIHIDPSDTFVFIRMRIDGILHIFQQLPNTFLLPLTSTFKVYANMDIAESRLPQDGQISVSIHMDGLEESEHPTMDIRVGSVPTIHGEKLTLRILDSNKMDLKLSSLGFESSQLATIETLVQSPQGMILVSGPTGSGKTTTLFSILNEIKGIANNIVTVEDPVEYRMSWLNQVEVNQQIGLTFASACRSFLRLDPDAILVGEIRDSETANIAVQNALVGTLLLSTLHSNSAVGIIQRLISLGIPRFWITSTLSAAIGQRLVRRICPKCKVQYYPDAAVRQALHLSENKKYYKGLGCEHCLHTGYKGRMVLSELLILNDPLRQAIDNNLNEHEILSIAIQHGFKPFLDDARLKLDVGDTSPEEVMRILTT